jgi:uncharacterized membrane protein YdbT with pleckstrin-like domain
MSCYLKKKVLGVTESIRIVPRKNAIFLVLKWIWGILGCWLLLIPTIKAIAATIRFTHTEYLITDKNVMEKYNVFNTVTNQMPLDKIENIVVTYTFWGKVFNYGNIAFSGANKNPVVFVCVKNAERIKKQVNAIM